MGTTHDAEIEERKREEGAGGGRERASEAERKRGNSR